MVVHQNQQPQIDTEPELLVMCIILVSQRCILGQGNLVAVLIAIMQEVCHTVLAFIIYFKTISECQKYFFTVFNLHYEGPSVIIIV